MPYVRDNYIKTALYIREVYLKVKEEDIPDTRIVRNVFPKYGIFLGYRQWMDIKGMRINRSEEEINPNQLSLFS